MEEKSMGQERETGQTFLLDQNHQYQLGLVHQQFLHQELQIQSSWNILKWQQIIQFNLLFYLQTWEIDGLAISVIHKVSEENRLPACVRPLLKCMGNYILESLGQPVVWFVEVLYRECFASIPLFSINAILFGK